MKMYELVKLTNEKPYKQNNLQKDMHGIVVDKNAGTISVLFFNPQNVGNCIVADVNIHDLSIDKEKLPHKVQQELSEKINVILKKAKNVLDPIVINEYDMVELIVDAEEYTKFGVHKGDRGCVMNNTAVQNHIEVDFSGIDEKGNYYGDCISVKIEDLRVIK